MTKHQPDNCYSDEGLHGMVEKLNAFTSTMFPWRLVQARKQHEDIFGETIKDREMYFKIEAGQAFDNVIKVSQGSMDKLVFVLFRTSPMLEDLAGRILKDRDKNRPLPLPREI